MALQAINAALYYERRFGETSSMASSNEKEVKKGDFLTRNLRRAITEETIHLEAGLTILATIGSTAPFIGLFGTVLGIHDALIAISHRGTATLDTVAAPVGEALIMTAFGLMVAIPAVIGYNLLVRSHRVFINKLEGFAHDLYTCLSTGARMDMKNTIYIKHQIQPTG
jgi:biopolymer transport protein ExbB